MSRFTLKYFIWNNNCGCVTRSGATKEQHDQGKQQNVNDSCPGLTSTKAVRFSVNDVHKFRLYIALKN